MAALEDWMEEEKDNQEYRAQKRQEIQIHNERIYKDFEFFLKVTIVIIRGIGFFLFQSSIKELKSVALAIRALSSLELLIMFMASLSIDCHQASEIMRRTKEVKLVEMWRWQDV